MTCSIERSARSHIVARTLTASIVTAVAGLPALADAQEGGALPLRHGLYVDDGIDCASADNATTMSYWGDQLNSAQFIGHIGDVREAEDGFLVTLDREGNSGMGGDQRDQVEELIAISGPEAFIVENEYGAFSYRWCASSADELTRMKQQGHAGTSSGGVSATAATDQPAFVGTWGAAGGASEVCSDHNITVYRPDQAESMHAILALENTTEVAPGHWRIDAYSSYEGSRNALVLDLHIDGDTMQEIITRPDGFASEQKLVRCD